MLSKLTNSPNEPERTGRTPRPVAVIYEWLVRDPAVIHHSWRWGSLRRMDLLQIHSLSQCQDLCPTLCLQLQAALPHFQRLLGSWWIIISGGISNCSFSEFIEDYGWEEVSMAAYRHWLAFWSVCFYYSLWIYTGGLRFMGGCQASIKGSSSAKIYLATTMCQCLDLIGGVAPEA